MKWSRQWRRLDRTAASLRIGEQEIVVIPDFVLNSHSPVKIFKIRAAAKCHMLAIVDVFTGRKTIGSRAAAKAWILLEQSDTHSLAGKRNRRSKSGKTAADDDYVWLPAAQRRHSSGFQSPVPARNMIHAFSSDDRPGCRVARTS